MEALVFQLFASGALLLGHLAASIWNRVTRDSRGAL
jgi:hypothetical protein